MSASEEMLVLARPPTAPRGLASRGPASRVVSGMLTVCSTVLGAALSVLYYAYRKVTRAFVESALALLKALGLAPLVARVPTASAALAIAVGVTAAPYGDRLFSWAKPDLSAVAGLVAFWLATGLLMLANGVLTTPPGRVDGLRALVARRWPERWFAGVLANPLDAVFVRIAFNNTLLVVPSLVAFALRPRPSLLTAVLFLLGQRLVALIHEAMDHANIHNQVFAPKREASTAAALLCRAIGAYHEYALNMAVSRIPGWYPIQHVAVHHAEDGSLDDNQTTVLRDRTSFFQYCSTVTNWTASKVLGLDVARYLWTHRRTRLFRSFVLHMIGYFAALALLAQVCWPAALLLLFARAFAIPDSVITHYNWHGFVDGGQFGNVYRNTVHVAGEMEHGYYGLNAHLYHHHHPACHWSELAPKARAEVPRYREEGVAILLPQMRDRTLLLRLLFERRFTEMAAQFVAIGDASREEIPRILEERTRPLTPRCWPRPIERLDRALGIVVARVLL